MEKLKFFLDKFFFKRRKSLSQLKVEVNNKVNDIIKDINKKKVKDEDFRELLDMVFKLTNVSKKSIEDWTYKVTASLTPESVSEVDELLYDLRWDIIFLSKEDYFKLHDYVSYSLIVCETMISDKIKSTLALAEQIVLKEEIKNTTHGSIFSNSNDDLIN